MGNKLRLTGKQLRRIISEAMSGRGIPAESMAPRDPRRSVDVKMAKADQVVADAVMLGEFTPEHAEAILGVLKFEGIPQKFSAEDMREIWTQMGLQSIVNRLDAMVGLSSDEIEATWDALGADIEMEMFRIATDFDGRLAQAAKMRSLPPRGELSWDDHERIRRLHTRDLDYQ